MPNCPSLRYLGLTDFSHAFLCVASRSVFRRRAYPVNHLKSVNIAFCVD